MERYYQKEIECASQEQIKYHSTLHFTIIQRTLQEGMCCFMVVFYASFAG